MAESASCDWRVNILNCEGSPFFKIVYLLGQIFNVICCLAFILSLIVRKCLMGHSWQSLMKGENLFLIIVVIAGFVNMVYFSTLMLGGSSLLASVFWSMIVPIKTIPSGQLLKITLQAIPDSVLNRGNSSSINGLTNTRVFFISAMVILLINMVMIPLAFSYIERGETAMLGKKIEQSALTITAINTSLFIFGLVLCSHYLKRRIQKVIGDTKRFSTGEVDQTLLLLTIQKLRVFGFVAPISITIDATFYLLLAFYPGFFTNMAFSKAFAVIMIPCYFLNFMMFSLASLIVDVKRWIYTKQMKEHSSSKGSKKEESIAPPTRLSTAGKDQVELIINDLQQ